jgi:hypothetical protein
MTERAYLSLIVRTANRDHDCAVVDCKSGKIKKGTRYIISKGRIHGFMGKWYEHKFHIVHFNLVRFTRDAK